MSLGILSNGPIHYSKPSILVEHSFGGGCFLCIKK
jgi:hypothetical protein